MSDITLGTPHKAEVNLTIKKMMENKEQVCKVTYGTPHGAKFILKAGNAKDVFAKGYVEVIPGLDVKFHFEQDGQGKKAKTTVHCELEVNEVLIPILHVLTIKQLNPSSPEYNAMLELMSDYQDSCNGVQKPEISLPDKKIVIAR